MTGTIQPARRAWRACLLAPLLVVQCACATLDYYGQALAGQFEIWRLARPLDEALADTALTPGTRAALAAIGEARAFASARLALPAGASYTRYADLGREYVVWNVFAAPALSLAPLASCFPLIGCLDYRGYFDPARAESHARSLRAQGHDVWVGGVAAYSTLGWFADPVLNTMLGWGEDRLVEIVFHELAHRRVYLPGDSGFNESYAMAVAAAGMRAWFAARGGDAAAWLADEDRDREFRALLAGTRAELAALYAGPAPASDKLAAKAAAFERLRARYAAARAGWHGDGRYDEWMARDLNNAKLASIATYHARVGGFTALLTGCDGDFAAFHAAVEALAERPAAARDGALTAFERADPEGPAAARAHCRATGATPM